MKIAIRNPEMMGILGLGWDEKVVSFMKDRLSGIAKTKINVDIVKNMYNYYMASLATGGKPVGFVAAPDAAGNGGDFDINTLRLADSIQASTNTDSSTVLNYLRAIWVLARDGKIPYEKWNPSEYLKTTDLRKSIPTEQSGVLKQLGVVAGQASSTGKILLVVAGLGVTAYLLSQLKAFGVPFKK